MIEDKKIIEEPIEEEAFNEDFDISIDKRGDDLSIETSGDEAKEVLEFARCVLGDNFDAFDCDFGSCADEVPYECEPAEFDYDVEEKEEECDPDFAFDCDYDIGEEPVEAPAEAEEKSADDIPTEEAPTEEETKAEEPVEEEDPEERPQMDMVDGKLVLSSENEAAGFDDDEEIEESFSDEDFALEFAEELKKKDRLTEGKFLDKLKAVKEKIKSKVDLNSAIKLLNSVFKFRVKEIGKETKIYEAKDLKSAEKLAIEASKKADVEKAEVLAVDYLSDELRKLYKDPSDAILNIGIADKKDIALETFRSGKLSAEAGEADVRITVATELKAMEATKKASEVPQEEQEPENKEISSENTSSEEDPTENSEISSEALKAGDKRGEILNRKVKRNKVILGALKDAGYDTSDLADGRKSTDKLNKLRKDIFGESMLKEDYIPATEEEQKLWVKLEDENCGPFFEYELEYDPDYDFYDNPTMTKDGYIRDYDGDYRKAKYDYSGRYKGIYTYYTEITFQDVLDWLEEDHLTPEGAEKFLEDDKKRQDSDFLAFLKERYVEKAEDQFNEELEDGDLDDMIDWDIEYPDYDDYD